MELRIDESRYYGALVANDVFIDDGYAWQKLKNGRSFCPAQNVEQVFGIYTRVDYVGYGTWPIDERLKGVMPSE